VIFENNDADGDGGAIYNHSGHAFIYRSTIKSNSAGRDGGGLYDLNHLSIQYSVFSGNQAVQNGGAVYHGTGATGSGIENSTFYDNNADRGGGFYSLTTLIVRNCTLSANHASATGGAVYGGFETAFENSILANSSSGGNCDNEGTKPTDGDNNIDSGATCGWGATKGSMSNTNPLLGPLQLNGGLTKTMALLAGSPAVDAVIYNAPNDCPEDDQRGYPRPFGLRCDIGAFERYYRLFMPQVMKN
jgi:predicted outer membrane repeat protein